MKKLKEFSEKELAEMLKEQVTGLPENLDDQITTKRKRPSGKIALHGQKPTSSKEEDTITNEEISTEEEEVVTAIPTTSLISWFRRYKKTVPPDIKTIKFGVAGVEPDSYLFITVPNPKGGIIKNGEPKREVIMFRNANKIPVIDLPITDISIYPSGFRMVHPFNGSYFKCYGGKPNNLVISISNNMRIPYHIVKIKNSSNALILKENTINMDVRLNDEANREVIKTLYPVIANVDGWKNMRKNIDVCKFFLSLQRDIKDNAHHIKLDNIMIGMITGTFPDSKEKATHVDYQIMIERGK